MLASMAQGGASHPALAGMPLPSTKGQGGHCTTSKAPLTLVLPAKGPGGYLDNTMVLLPTASTSKDHSTHPLLRRRRLP